MLGIKDDEMMARWTQYGIFSPVMRLHSQYSEFCGKEPWRYKQETVSVMSDALRFRHKMLPYLYTMNHRCYAAVSYTHLDVYKRQVHKVTILPLPPKDAFAWKVKQNKGKHQNKVPLLVQTAQNIFSATIKHSIFRHYCYIADLQNIEHCAGIKGMP